MEVVDLNKILNRNKLFETIKTFFINFEKNKNDLTSKRGIYIYGNPGTGKTSFIENLKKIKL